MTFLVNQLSGPMQEIGSYFFPPIAKIELPIMGVAEWRMLGLEVEELPIPPSVWERYQTNKSSYSLSLIPANLSLEEFYQKVAKNRRPPYYIDRAETPKKSYWCLMTRTAIPETCGCSFSKQQELLEKMDYSTPKLLEAAIAIWSAKNTENLELFPSEGQWTRCQEQEEGRPLVIGYDGSLLFTINQEGFAFSNGVAGVVRC